MKRQSKILVLIKENWSIILAVLIILFIYYLMTQK